MTTATATDALLDLTVHLHRSAPRSANRAALDTLRDGLVEELGLTPAEATREIRAAMIRRAQASRNPATRQLAAELAKVEGL
jgi:uncharacterized protein YjiS (DUF1127 family)